MKTLTAAILVFVLMVSAFGMVPIASSEHIHQNSATFPKTALLEVFTGTWCEYCPAADGAAYRLAENYSINQLAIVEYHDGDNFTSLGSLTSVRETFYDVPGFPQAFFSGVNSSLGGSTNPMDNTIYEEYKEKVDAQLKNRSNVALSVNTNLEGNDLYVTVNVTASQKPSLQNLSLLTMLVYDENWTVGKYHIRYTGEEWISNQPIILNNNTVITRKYHISLNSEWVKSKLYVLSFVQTRDKYKVVQGTDQWYEAPVLNAVIHPIKRWQINPERSAVEVNVNSTYTLNTTVENDMGVSKTLTVGFDPTTVPQGWNVKILVDGKEYNSSQVNITLAPGTKKKVYYEITADTEATGFIKIYAGNAASPRASLTSGNASKYDDVHYILVDSTGEVPVPEFTSFGIAGISLMLGAAILVLRRWKK